MRAPDVDLDAIVRGALGWAPVPPDAVAAALMLEGYLTRRRLEAQS